MFKLLKTFLVYVKIASESLELKIKLLILYGLRLIVLSFHYVHVASTEEYSRLERALKLSRSILAYVNQAVKDCENRNKLRLLQRRVDKRQMDSPEFKVNTFVHCICTLSHVKPVFIILNCSFHIVITINREQ